MYYLVPQENPGDDSRLHRSLRPGFVCQHYFEFHHCLSLRLHIFLSTLVWKQNGTCNTAHEWRLKNPDVLQIRQNKTMRTTFFLHYASLCHLRSLALAVAPRCHLSRHLMFWWNSQICTARTLYMWPKHTKAIQSWEAARSIMGATSANELAEICAGHPKFKELCWTLDPSWPVALFCLPGVVLSGELSFYASMETGQLSALRCNDRAWPVTSRDFGWFWTWMGVFWFELYTELPGITAELCINGVSWDWTELYPTSN